MALTIRNVKVLRPPLDSYKKENDISTDSKAIESMVLNYATLENALKQANVKIEFLDRQLYVSNLQLENLGSALKPLLQT